MAQGGAVSQAQIKQDLEQLGRDLFTIDLETQNVKAGTQQGNFARLEADKEHIK